MDFRGGFSPFFNHEKMGDKTKIFFRSGDSERKKRIDELEVKIIRILSIIILFLCGSIGGLIAYILLR